MKEKNILREIKTLDHLVINKLGINNISNIKRMTPSQIYILEYIINSSKKEVYSKRFRKNIKAFKSYGF